MLGANTAAIVQPLARFVNPLLDVTDGVFIS